MTEKEQYQEHPDGNTTGTNRRTFSVSKEFSDILTEIDKMPNMSRFVCEAVKEKLERMKNPGKEVAEALANFAMLQKIISEPIQALQQFNNVEVSAGVDSPPAVSDTGNDNADEESQMEGNRPSEEKQDGSQVGGKEEPPNPDHNNEEPVDEQLNEHMQSDDSPPPSHDEREDDSTTSKNSRTRSTGKGGSSNREEIRRKAMTFYTSK